MIHLSATVAATRTLEDIKHSGMLEVGLTGDYAPYSLRSPGGRISGADVTMAMALEMQLRAKLIIVPTTWKSTTSDFEADRFDLALGGMSVTAERQALSRRPLAYGRSPMRRC
jgi:cyclohexadienyl dehydratase